MTTALFATIEAMWDDPERTGHPDIGAAIAEVMHLIDGGNVRCATTANGTWVVNQPVKKAIALYFRTSQVSSYTVGPIEYRDKFPIKRNFDGIGVRVVPPACVRYGAYLSPGVTLMPSFVNLGVWIGADTLIDTWVSVGIGAQIGAEVTILPGTVIGGALDPITARPVIVEDRCYLGTRCILAGQVIVGRGAIVGPSVAVTPTTPLIDITKDPASFLDLEVPPEAIVSQGSWPIKNATTSFMVPAALVVGYRDWAISPTENLLNAFKRLSLADEAN